MNKRIYLDMDGTLCRFHDVEHKYVEQMWEPGFYIQLKPFQEFLNAISLCIDRNPDTEFFVLSAVLDTEPPFAAEEKREWLHTHLPQLADDHMLFVPAGADKTAYVPNLNADCILIDDYNKNLSEWSQSGGTAIKFVNDINDRGLGAYGGEQGKLWDGARVWYDDSAMASCLNLERCAGISRTGENSMAFYGFDGDVSAEEFLALLQPYFSIRQANDDQLIATLYRRGEVFVDYNSVSADATALAKAFSETAENQLAAQFKEQYGVDDAMLQVLNTCYTLSRANDITPNKVIGWITASVKQGLAWKTYPVTSSNLQAFLTRMLARDEQMKLLYAQIKTLSVELKQMERQLYIPSLGEVAKNVLSNHTQTSVLTKRCQNLSELLSALKTEWCTLAGTEYPQILFGSGRTQYQKYASLQKEQSIYNQK